MSELLAQAPRLDAHDRIDDGVERIRAPKDFQCDAIALEPLAASGESLVDDVFQEPLLRCDCANGPLLRMRPSCSRIAFPSLSRRLSSEASVTFRTQRVEIRTHMPAIASQLDTITIWKQAVSPAI